MWHRTQNELAARFEENRPRLRAVALRMLGSPAEADDAVQEAWLRLSRTGDDSVDNLSAWLTTVVGRVCLDLLRQRTARREDEFSAEPPATGDDPEQRALLADSVGLALLVVLETLTPAERLAFVLHDLFAVSFEEIAPIVGRSPDAARQLASRARRRVRATPPENDAPADRHVVDAFLTASRGGELGTLLALLDPDVEMRVDRVVQNRGADAVARFFTGRARAARTALIDGAIGFAVIVDDQVKVVTRITVDHGRITAMDAITSPAHLSELVIQPF
ncbi:sigma-70 family RNA polymerase sigma factor [Paractinoplanes toevensis]|uniref:RNA polymerase sigma factor n=1 Tax=Paractinoplanes toevensis TaxID=571911 RepID=A0A919T4H0_9ACTN|nr:sigma-70 family RNA polymerase sigma factor [Actinoplanes toevensis]GIM89048.1 RNA polymerase sigma factor [Actinoplanes toevensis]